MRRRDTALESPHHGSRLLAHWLQRFGLSQAALARALGVTPPAVCDWIARKKLPEPAYRAAIATYTGREVPASSWCNDEERALYERLRSVEPYVPEHPGDASLGD